MYTIYILSIFKIKLQRHIFSTCYNNVLIYTLTRTYIATLIISVAIFVSDIFFKFQKYLKVSLQYNFIIVSINYNQLSFIYLFRGCLEWGQNKEQGDISLILSNASGINRYNLFQYNQNKLELPFSLFPTTLLLFS